MRGGNPLIVDSSHPDPLPRRVRREGREFKGEGEKRIPLARGRKKKHWKRFHCCDFCG